MSFSRRHSQMWSPQIRRRDSVSPFWQRHPDLHEVAAEVFGTCIMHCFGCGAGAQVMLFSGNDGQHLSISLGWALGAMFGVLATFQISGAHMNPAVTLAAATYKGFPWRKVPGYMAAQLLGAFLGSFFVWVIYYDTLVEFTGHNFTLATAGIWATYPAGVYISRPVAILNEAVGCALLLISVFSIADTTNDTFKTAGFVAMTVLALSVCLAANTGGAINPARDLGPRLFTFAAGYGSEVFTCFGYYFWIPIVGPFAGALVGGGVQQLLETDNNCCTLLREDLVEVNE